MANFLFDDAVRMYARKAARNNYKRLTHDVYLYKYSDHFRVRLFSTDIVSIYPDHQVLHPGGWHSMRTAKEMNGWSAAQNVYLSKGSLRIYHPLLKNRSCPVINGMKIMNNGMVFEGDITSDWKDAIKPEVVRAWKALTMPITKALKARFAMGEFNDIALQQCTGANIYMLAALDPVFPDHDEVEAILCSVQGYADPKRGQWGVAKTMLSVEQRWRNALDKLRGDYYTEHNGHMQVEVPNV